MSIVKIQTNQDITEVYYLMHPTRNVLICSFPESWSILGQLLNMPRTKWFFSVKEMTDGNLIPLPAHTVSMLNKAVWGGSLSTRQIIEDKPVFLSPVTLPDACKAAMVVQAAGLCSCLVLAVASVRGLETGWVSFPIKHHLYPHTC